MNVLRTSCIALKKPVLIKMLGTALYPTVRESVYKHAPLTALSSCIFATFGCHVISEEMSESKSQRINYYTRRNVQILPSTAED